MTAKTKQNKWDMKNASGQYLTNSLFLETKPQITSRPPIYTFKDEDWTSNGKKYISLKALYLQYNHAPGSEYEFANDHLGGWEHWQILCNGPKTGPYIQQWREELEVKIRCAAVKEVIVTSRSEKGFQAAKWLAEGGYAPQKRGRPSKEEVERQRRIEAGVKSDIEDMWNRIQ